MGYDLYPLAIQAGIVTLGVALVLATWRWRGDSATRKLAAHPLDSR